MKYLRDIARNVMLRHLFSFPDDMEAERCALQKRLDVKDSIVFASFQRLEFEILEALKDAAAREREACAIEAERRGSAECLIIGSKIRRRGRDANAGVTFSNGPSTSKKP